MHTSPGARERGASVASAKTNRRRLTLGLAIGLAGCGQAPAETYDALPGLRRALSGYALSVEPAATAIAHLAYRPPPEGCPHVLRLSADYEPALLHEDANVGHLALGRHEKDEAVFPSGSFEKGVLFEGELFYQGIRAEQHGVVRDWFLSATMAGPAAPTAACFPRTWDPIEDAFALGWPRLPGGPAAVGDTWTGLRVEGKCNRSACVDPVSGGGGPENHHRTCVTPSWKNTLSGVYEVGEHRVALVQGQWSDGHGEKGIWTESMTVISIDHGRPLWSRVVVHHGFNQPTADRSFAPVERTWTMEAIDDCSGSLTDLGWETPLEARNEVAHMLDRLARADELRKSRGRTDDQPGSPMEEGASDGR